MDYFTCMENIFKSFIIMCNDMWLYIQKEKTAEEDTKV